MRQVFDSSLTFSVGQSERLEIFKHQKSKIQATQTYQLMANILAITTTLTDEKNY